MKKIALLHFAYPPNIGGVETVISEQANILSGLGYDISVLTGSGKEMNPRIRLTEIPQFQSVLRFNPELAEKILQRGIIDDEFYKVAKDIEEILEVELKDREVIIVHNMLTIIRNLPFILAFKKFVKSHPEKKIIVWVHDQTYIDGERILTEEPGVKLAPLTKELLLTPIPNASYIFISETFKNLFKRLINISDDQVTVIPDGINIQKFLEIDDALWQIYQKNQILTSFPIILSPINILPRKNIEYSLEVINCLKRYYPSIKYVISGNTSKHRITDDYFALITQKVDSLGLKSNMIFLKDFFASALEVTQIHDLYQLSDLIFYFSRSENFGLPIIETILTKSMLFASNLKVFKEIVGEDIFFIDTNQKPEDTALKIKKFLENNPQIKAASRARVNYNLESIIKDRLIPFLQ